MDINGLNLPDAFVHAVTQDMFGGRERLRPRNGVDTSGYALLVDLAEVYQEQATLMQATLRVAVGFELDDWYGARTPDAPGSIPDIVDFSQIVCFGSSAEGEPFCFDFRNDTVNPSVICWDGDALSWRRIAPDFEAFLRLFGLQL